MAEQSLISQRIYVEKKPEFRSEAQEICRDLNENLNLTDLRGVRLINTYDIFDIKPTLLARAVASVFSEPVTDEVLVQPDFSGCRYLASEPLPGQFDQRADSALQCVHLLDPSAVCKITSGRVLVFQGTLSDSEFQRVSAYLINPIDTRIKDLSVLQIDADVAVTPMETFDSFCQLDEAGLKQLQQSHSLAMSLADLQLVQTYFQQQEHRNPSETELRVLDTYWSDHCRHTTFETQLQDVRFDHARFQEQIEQAWQRYLRLRQETGRSQKPVTLMDMAAINSRSLRSRGKLPELEVSEEINACSVFVTVDHDGQPERWLLQFKNETHNHPTEIEPFGGASTCIGGAIRDPLAGRAYVYQAMRISGCGDVFQPLSQTLPGKLPQRVLSAKAARGNSSYGNQIGLPTTYVHEITHPGYVAKHLEAGAVVGAVKADSVVRQKPQPGDVVLLVGGRTGRDGIGGATGSSQEHNNTSLRRCASQVQKGNAVEERKIQRLFRNPACTKLIRKCNDFGAGGVAVAIGELADGLLIHLDQVRTKYAGLNATELAISESQERMAVVVAAADRQTFIQLAQQENLEAYQVAEVTDSGRLVMREHDQTVVDLDRRFIDSAGVRQSAAVNMTAQPVENPFLAPELNRRNILAMLKDPNVASQKGLGEMFDASIGAGTVLMPYGGKTQLTPTQAGVVKLPVQDGRTHSCSVLAYGYDPEIMSYSCFIGAMYSVLLSMAKVVAVGGNPDQMYFSFQEYFQRLNDDPAAWGTVTEAMLGGIQVLDFFQKAAIGGKDSMSGTFNQIHVPPTLISFACALSDTREILPQEFQQAGDAIGVFLPTISSAGYPDLSSYQEIFTAVRTGIQKQEICAAYVAEQGGILAAVCKMSFGNELGFELDSSLPLLQRIPAAIVVESRQPLAAARYQLIGRVAAQGCRINRLRLDPEEVLTTYTDAYHDLYPLYAPAQRGLVSDEQYHTDHPAACRFPTDTVRVLIPVFPGTNCEYDMARAFAEEGAEPDILVFQNQSEEAVLRSIQQLSDHLDQAQILALPGGFSAGDEPDGSAKFIVNVLQNATVKAAIERLLKQRDGLILGICNGFQALVKSGLLPYGEIRTPAEDDPTLFRNPIGRHVSTMVYTRKASDNSPWLAGDSHEVYSIPVSHGEGRFIVSEKQLASLKQNGQIAFQYADSEGNASLAPQYCINGSTDAIEGILSKDGRILGKMGHSERYCRDVFKNIPGLKKQPIFRNGVNYFRRKKQ